MTMNYNNPVPVAAVSIGVQIQDSIKLLCVVRAKGPAGGICLPCGYLDQGESAEQAAVRELQEEVGLVIGAKDLNLRYTRTNDQNKLLIFFKGPLITEREYEMLKEEFEPNSEILDITVIDDPCLMCFPFHKEFAAKLLTNYFDN